MSVRVQALGLCRWNYPSAPGAFQRDAKGGLSAIRAALYDPARLAMRLFFLEHVVLPPLRSQTDTDFRVVLLMGDQLPDAPRRRVLELIADIPQISPVFAEEGRPHQEICRQVMQAEREADARAVAEFRIDDDDAVAVDFIERTRDGFLRTKAMFRTGGKLALDFNRGFILATGHDGLDVHPVFARYWTPGLVVFQRPNSDQSLLDFNHAQLWKRIPTVTFPKVPMFLRGAHGGNDSSVSHNPHNAETAWTNSEQMIEILRERFDFNYKSANDAWVRLLDGASPPA